MSPKWGEQLQDEIQCCALPYGAIGLLSHVLTYYKIYMLTIGHSSLLPWKKLKLPKWDLVLSVTGLILGFAFTIHTMVQCKQRWQFMLTAVWKATLSISVGALSVHASVMAWGGGAGYSPSLRLLLIIYVIGTIIGLAGLFSLVVLAWGERIIFISTCVFGGIVGVAVLIVCGFMSCGCHFMGTSIATCLILLGGSSALYSDWVLTSITGSVVRLPSRDTTALYFAYFMGKRLPLLVL
jgi:hypothetical protein